MCQTEQNIFQSLYNLKHCHLHLENVILLTQKVCYKSLTVHRAITQLQSIQS